MPSSSQSGEESSAQLQMQDLGRPGDADVANPQRWIRGRPKKRKRGIRKVKARGNLPPRPKWMGETSDSPGNLQVHFIEMPEATVSGISI